MSPKNKKPVEQPIEPPYTGPIVDPPAGHQSKHKAPHRTAPHEHCRAWRVEFGGSPEQIVNQFDTDRDRLALNGEPSGMLADVEFARNNAKVLAGQVTGDVVGEAGGNWHVYGDADKREDTFCSFYLAVSQVPPEGLRKTE